MHLKWFLNRKWSHEHVGVSTCRGFGSRASCQWCSVESDSSREDRSLLLHAETVDQSVTEALLRDRRVVLWSCVDVSLVRTLPDFLNTLSSFLLPVSVMMLCCAGWLNDPVTQKDHNLSRRLTALGLPSSWSSLVHCSGNHPRIFEFTLSMLLPWMMRNSRLVS